MDRFASIVDEQDELGNEEISKINSVISGFENQAEVMSLLLLLYNLKNEIESDRKTISEMEQAS